MLTPFAPDDDDPRLFDTMPMEVQDALRDWIAHCIHPGTTGRKRTSYGLKHTFGADTNIYVKNGTFKGAMLAAGYLPRDATAKNWSFNIGKVNERTRRSAYPIVHYTREYKEFGR